MINTLISRSRVSLVEDSSGVSSSHAPEQHSFALHRSTFCEQQFALALSCSFAAHRRRARTFNMRLKRPLSGPQMDDTPEGNEFAPTPRRHRRRLYFSCNPGRRHVGTCTLYSLTLEPSMRNPLHPRARAFPEEIEVSSLKWNYTTCDILLLCAAIGDFHSAISHRRKTRTDPRMRRRRRRYYRE